MRHQLEIIDFDTPYNNPQTLREITDHTKALLANELPAFQVEVGDDRHLAGTLAVQGIIEAAVRNTFSDIPYQSQSIPFALSHQSMRAPFYPRPRYARSNTLTPHIDKQQIGPAIHKEYVGIPAKVQFGYKTGGIELPPVVNDYRGPDLSEFADTVYEGTTQLGRLSIFSQGNPAWDLQPSAHYFEREPDQKIGGRYTRYSMLEPDPSNFPVSPEEYPSFVAMRKKAAVHLDWWQWKLLQEELAMHSADTLPPHPIPYADMAEMHMKDHPGKQYIFWMTANTDDVYHYGV